MMTRFITNVTTKFNPFSPKAKAPRLFLSLLPPNARSTGMSITTQLLPKASSDPGSLHVKFCTSRWGGKPRVYATVRGGWLTHCGETADGREMSFDGDAYEIKGIVEEVDRHSRMLQKQADLSDG